jgi:Arc/MetJ family transcription regulator
LHTFETILRITALRIVDLHISVCNHSGMATNLAIDDRLLEEARKVGGLATKKATVTQALAEYIARRKQARILDLFGRVEFDPSYDHKKQRRRA